MKKKARSVRCLANTNILLNNKKKKFWVIYFEVIEIS